MQSLIWRSDTLVDLAGGGAVYQLDGTIERPHFTCGPTFDAAVGAPDGRHAVVYQRLGTKALLFRDNELVRELDRSFYQADAYEYPVGFVTLPDGRTALVHCPDAYNQLEIEDALTGERLTTGPREPADMFHSRLAASPGNRRLLSAGWFWHPFDAVVFFDVAEVLRDPCALDRLDSLDGSGHVGLAEESGAAWIDDELVILAGGAEDEDPGVVEEVGNPPRLRSCGLAVIEVATNAIRSSVQLPAVAGTIMFAGDNRVVSFFREPKLIALDTGEVLHRWSGVSSGTNASSICWHLPAPVPPIALDPARRRFAVASGGQILVVELD